MSKICPKCGKEYDDNILNCPHCEPDQKEEVLEVIETIQTPIENKVVETLTEPEIIETTEEVVGQPETVVNETKVVEEASVSNTPVEIEQSPTITEVEQPGESLPQVEPVVEVPVENKGLVLDMPTLDDIHPTNTTDAILDKMEEENTPEPVLKAESSGLESISLEEVSVIVDESSLEPAVENEELESVSISAPQESLEEKEEEFVIPEMPAPTVGEINPELLGNKYDAEEAINNQKIEAKKQQDAMEMERIRQEAEAKKSIPMEKPDLLARIPDPDEEVELSTPKKKGKPMRKFLNTILVILGIAVIAAAIWYFFFQEKEDANKNNYMEPVETYLYGYRDADASKMLSAFVPCVAKSEDISIMVTNLISTRNQYKEVTLEFSEKNAEVVNSADQQSLNEYLKNVCGTEAPEVKDYKQVYVEQKIKTEQDKDFVIKNPKFWNVMIEDTWYILMVE